MKTIIYHQFNPGGYQNCLMVPLTKVFWPLLKHTGRINNIQKLSLYLTENTMSALQKAIGQCR
jgi:hypothetical protein